MSIGLDLVSIPGFAAQLAEPGTAFERVFTEAERRTARRRAATSGSPAAHLAARWAAKEAFVKAWSLALRGQEPPLAEITWSDIEVTSDRWGRPGLRLAPRLWETVVASLGGEPELCLSLSHDGDMAGAIVQLTTRGTLPEPTD